MEKVKIYLDEEVRPLLAEVGTFWFNYREQLDIAIKEKRAILTL